MNHMYVLQNALCNDYVPFSGPCPGFNFLDNPVAFNARRSRLVSTFQLHAYQYQWGMPGFRGFEVLNKER